MHTKQGFTLIELMIVVAIIGILASIALSTYQNFLSRVRAAGAIAELNGYRHAITLCGWGQQTFIGCNAGTNGVPALSPITKNIVGWTGITNGVISATSGATASPGGANLTVVLTPSLPPGNANFVWVNTGTVCNPTRGLQPGQGDCP